MADIAISCCCFYGWVVWALLLVGNVVVFFGASSGVTFIIPALREDMQLTQSSVALAYTVSTAVSATVQYPLGRAVDHAGGRSGVAVMSALFAISVGALSLAANWWSLALAFGLLRALGVGGLETACNTCLQQWFERRRGLATGLGSSLTQLISYAVLSNVDSALVHSIGWRQTYALVGVVLLALYSPLAAVCLRSCPEDVGLRPDGDPPMQATGPAAQAVEAPGTADAAATAVPAADMELNAPEASATARPKCIRCCRSRAPMRTREVSYTPREAARTHTFALLATGNALAWGVGSGVFFNLTSIVTGAGLAEEAVASTVYVPWAICRAASMVLAGLALDLCEPRYVLAAGLLLNGSGIALLSQPFGGTLTPLRAVLFGVVHGLGNGASSCTFKAVPAIFFGRMHLGSISGALAALNLFSTAIGPLLVGAAFDALGSYRGCLRWVAAATAGFALAALCMTTLIKRMAAGHEVERGGLEAVVVEGELTTSNVNAHDGVAKAGTHRVGGQKGVLASKRAYAKLDE